MHATIKLFTIFAEVFLYRIPPIEKTKFDGMIHVYRYKKVEIFINITQSRMTFWKVLELKSFLCFFSLIKTIFFFCFIFYILYKNKATYFHIWRKLICCVVYSCISLETENVSFYHFDIIYVKIFYIYFKLWISFVLNCTF